MKGYLNGFPDIACALSAMRSAARSVGGIARKEVLGSVCLENEKQLWPVVPCGARFDSV